MEVCCPKIATFITQRLEKFRKNTTVQPTQNKNTENNKNKTIKQIAITTYLML